MVNSVVASFWTLNSPSSGATKRCGLSLREDRPVTEVAAKFGYKPAALSVMISRFNSQLRRGCVPPFFLLTAADAHRGSGDVKI